MIATRSIPGSFIFVLLASSSHAVANTIGSRRGECQFSQAATSRPLP
jgi:hypothetical protein